MLGGIFVFLGDFLDPFEADALDDEAYINEKYGIQDSEEECGNNACIK